MLAVLAYGAVSVFVLGLIPAFVICFRKGQWTMISVGFLTFGLGWWIGTLRGESRRRRRNVAAALLCAVLALGVLTARPVQFFGYDASSLEQSVNGGVAWPAQPCRRDSSDADWTCGRHLWSSDGGEAVYRIHVDPLGCWRGVAVSGDIGPEPPRISGCVHLEDY